MEEITLESLSLKKVNLTYPTVQKTVAMGDNYEHPIQKINYHKNQKSLNYKKKL